MSSSSAPGASTSSASSSFPFDLLPTTARERIVGYLPQRLYEPVVDALPLLRPHFVKQGGLLHEAVRAAGLVQGRARILP